MMQEADLNKLQTEKNEIRSCLASELQKSESINQEMHKLKELHAKELQSKLQELKADNESLREKLAALEKNKEAERVTN